MRWSDSQRRAGVAAVPQRVRQCAVAGDVLPTRGGLFHLHSARARATTPRSRKDRSCPYRRRPRRHRRPRRPMCWNSRIAWVATLVAGAHREGARGIAVGRSRAFATCRVRCLSTPASLLARRSATNPRSALPRSAVGLACDCLPTRRCRYFPSDGSLGRQRGASDSCLRRSVRFPAHAAGRPSTDPLPSQVCGCVARACGAYHVDRYRMRDDLIAVLLRCHGVLRLTGVMPIPSG